MNKIKILNRGCKYCLFLSEFLSATVSYRAYASLLPNREYVRYNCTDNIISYQIQKKNQMK